MVVGVYLLLEALHGGASLLLIILQVRHHLNLTVSGEEGGGEKGTREEISQEWFYFSFKVVSHYTIIGFDFISVLHCIAGFSM